MRDYEKDPLEELTKEQLEELLSVTNQEMPTSSLDKIKQQVHQEIKEAEKVVPITKKSKKKWPKVLGVVAVVSLMVGFTMKDNIKEAYYKAFGDESQKLLLNADQLAETTTDNGLKLTAKSSFKDGDTTYVFMDLQDLTGDRLSQDTIIDQWQMLNGGNARVVSYDDKSKTASLLVSSVSWENHEDKGFEMSRLSSGVHEQTETINVPWQDVLQTQTDWIKTPKKDGSGGGANPVELDKLGLDFDDFISEYIMPNVISYPLNQEETIILENAVFRDGLLNLLVKYPNDLYHNGLNLTLVSKDHKQQDIDYVVSYSVGNETHSNITGRKDYEQVVFNVTPSELKNYELKVDDYQTEDIINGQWAVKLKQPTELKRKNLGDVRLSHDELTLNNIELSGLSLSFDYEVSNEQETPLTIKLKLKNGEEREILSQDDFEVFSSSDTQSVNVQYDYLPLEDISEVIINDNTISVK